VSSAVTTLLVIFLNMYTLMIFFLEIYDYGIFVCIEKMLYKEKINFIRINLCMVVIKKMIEKCEV
jgi:hypothetical protein